MSAPPSARKQVSLTCPAMSSKRRTMRRALPESRLVRPPAEGLLQVLPVQQQETLPSARTGQAREGLSPDLRLARLVPVCAGQGIGAHLPSVLHGEGGRPAGKGGQQHSLRARLRECGKARIPRRKAREHFRTAGAAADVAAGRRSVEKLFVDQKGEGVQIPVRGQEFCLHALFAHVCKLCRLTAKARRRAAEAQQAGRLRRKIDAHLSLPEKKNSPVIV